jgi:hypothetical protein
MEDDAALVGALRHFPGEITAIEVGANRWAWLVMKTASVIAEKSAWHTSPLPFGPKLRIGQ